MQRDPLELAHRWLEQARADLEAGERNTDRPFLACFLAQQGAEKALKALLLWRAGDHMRVYLIATLLNELAGEHVSPELDADLRTLDKYYTTTRYPDSLDYALPAASFSTHEAIEALRIATEGLRCVATGLPPEPKPERTRKPGP